MYLRSRSQASRATGAQPLRPARPPRCSATKPRWSTALAGGLALLLAGCPAEPGASTDLAGTPDLATAPDLGGGGDQGGPGEVWRRPSCAAVSGPPLFTLSPDEGGTLLPSSEALPPSAFSFGLVATTRRDTLVGASGQVLYVSRDAGCSYQELARVPELTDLVRLTASPSGAVYAYSLSDASAVRVTLDGAREVLRLPVPQIRALAVARDQAAALAVSDRQTGQLYRSSDGGQSWSPSGAPPTTGGLLYFTAFDPAALDHVVVGTVAAARGTNRAGIQVTRDGGRTWVQGNPPAEAQGHAINGFDGLIHPGDGERVWLLGLDITESDGGAGNRARHLYLSQDGGLSYRALVSGADAGVTLTNGTPLFSPPAAPELLYFTFTDTIQGITTLWRLDTGGGLTRHPYPYAQTGELRAMAFHPNDRSVLYMTRTFQRVR